MKSFGTLLVFFLASFATAVPLSQDGLGRRGPGDTLQVVQKNANDGTYSRFIVSANPKGAHPNWDPDWFGGEQNVVENLKKAALGAIAMTDYNLPSNPKVTLKLEKDPQKTEDAATAYTWTVKVPSANLLTTTGAVKELQLNTKAYVKLAFDGKLK